MGEYYPSAFRFWVIFNFYFLDEVPAWHICENSCGSPICLCAFNRLFFVSDWQWFLFSKYFLPIYTWEHWKPKKCQFCNPYCCFLAVRFTKVQLRQDWRWFFYISLSFFYNIIRLKTKQKFLADNQVAGQYKFFWITVFLLVIQGTSISLSPFLTIIYWYHSLGATAQFIRRVNTEDILDILLFSAKFDTLKIR